MRFKFLFMLAFLIPFIVNAQAVYKFGTYDLFGSATVTLADTSADTSVVRSFNTSRAGDFRISAVLADTSSADTTEIFVAIGVKVTDEFGTSATSIDSLNFIWTTIDTLTISDLLSTQTYQIMPEFSFADSPIMGYCIVVWQNAGVQTNTLKFTVLEYKPQ